MSYNIPKGQDLNSFIATTTNLKVHKLFVITPFCSNVIIVFCKINKIINKNNKKQLKDLNTII